jgi:hypothetical protein
MIPDLNIDDSKHTYFETLREDGTVTLVIIDDEYTGPEDVLSKLQAKDDIQPKMVIWLSFCKAYEFFAQTGRLRKIKEGDNVHTIDLAYTLVLLDLRADKGKLIWDFQEGQCATLETPKDLYGLEILKLAKEQGYNLNNIWIYSSYRQSIVEAETWGITVNERNKDNFFRKLKGRIGQWSVPLEKISHQQWRELQTAADDTNHWPDFPPLSKSKSPSLDSASTWANQTIVSGHSLQSILEVTGYPKLGEKDWGAPCELIPALKWIAAQQDLARDGRQTICGAIRYFNYLAKKLSSETIAVSILSHFRHLTFNPYPLALWLQELTQSLSDMPLINDEPNKTWRTNDCFVHLELWKSKTKIIGTVQEGFVSVNPNAYPLKKDGRSGGGMHQILKLAALCGIFKLKFRTRVGGKAQTRTIDTLNKSVTVEDTLEDLILEENEILLHFEFDIGA